MVNYTVKITQDNFSAMRGHVADGTQVLMRNGDILSIRSVFPKGWAIYNGDYPEVCYMESAFEVECWIVGA